MLNYIKKKVVGSSSDRKIKKYAQTVTKINQLEDSFKGLTQEDCVKKTEEYKERYQKGEKLEALLPEAFALVRYAAMQTLGQRHFDVQLMGGMALDDNMIAEMKTGEGKTLTATLPVYLNALTGKGVHVVTVNDYLASRDAEWMGQIYKYLGMTVGLIQHGLNDEQRREAYGADITYGTNNEFGFDYLRDNMKFDLEDYVQREHYYAIVDEVDSILIDEARTPLIISGPTDDSTDKYKKIDKIMFGLTREWRVSDNPEAELVAEAKAIPVSEVKEFLKSQEDTTVIVPGHYHLDEKSKNIQLAEQGVIEIEKRLEGSLKTPSLYDFENIELLHHVNQALKARYVFKRDVDYVVQNGKVVIVDEFTGRLMEGRRFSDGLHQALEAKEHVTIEKENQTLASITFQNYFRKYDKLAGMTGTAVTEEGEFIKIYGLGVVVVPTNKPMVRKDQADQIYKTQEAKFRAILKQIEVLHEKQQPVLVGTASIESSEKLSRMLKNQKIPHSVLNAKYHEQEAEIIAKAGAPGNITIATNMAGRGTDIQLAEGVKELGGLFILGTERNESRRVDNQLRGRSGRQGDPGESRFYLSLDDDLLRIFGGERIANLMNKLRIEEDEAIEHILITKAIENSQKKVEGHNFEIRKHLLEFDDVMNQQREIIYRQRREILGEEVTGLLMDMTGDVVDDLLATYCNEKYVDQWDLETLNKELQRIFDVSLPEFSDDEKHEPEKLREVIHKSLEARYEEKAKEFGEHQQLVERQILLEISDSMWKDHLLSMDHLKEGIGLRSYAQKNPLDEYKKEAYHMFSDLMGRISMECVMTYYHVRIMHEPPQEQRRTLNEEEMQMTHESAVGPQAAEEPDPKKKQPTHQPRKKEVEIGRNEPCPCGSGKKYKSCHMREWENQ